VSAQVQSFGVCKPVAERSGELGCWILVDQPVGQASGAEMYWHLDAYADSEEARRARGAGGIVVHALGKTWLMTIDGARTPAGRRPFHVADIGPLPVHPGTEYAATFMEAISTPEMTSAVHRHSGPEAWYTVAGETCLETPGGTIVGREGKPAIVPQGRPMLLTTTGKQRRRAITLILHEAAEAPTTMETEWKPRHLCK
jgi:quercetin dioxygenase-like cupin family protein